MEKMTSKSVFSGGSNTALTKLAIFLSVSILAIFIFRDAWRIQAPPELPTPSVQEFDSPADIGGETIESSVESQIEPQPAYDVEPSSEPISTHGNSTNEVDCRELPGAERILVILKTGATAIYQRLPLHLSTTFKCIPNSIIISDLDQKFGERSVVDVLPRVTELTRTTSADFATYEDIQELNRGGQDISKLDSQLAWDLDKWKFLPMIHEAWESASANIDWFVMMEADTSLSWLNLLLWLRRLDPKKPLYLGSVAMLLNEERTNFAHGGSGIVMSRAAIEKLETTRKEAQGGPEAYDYRWEEKTNHTCCGDAILAMAFQEAGIPVTKAFPLIQGENPLTLDFSSEIWCSPAVTWHHVDPAEVDALWHFQMDWAQEHGWETPYLYRDVFATLIDSIISADPGVSREDWDNNSGWLTFAINDESYPKYDQYDQAATQSVTGCAEACIRRQECLQWKWTEGKCAIDQRIRVGTDQIAGKIVGKNEDGYAVYDDHEPRWTSGWLVERIEEFKKAQEPCQVRWAP